MKIKVMTLNQSGNIELSIKELERLLEEAYNDGYNDNYKLSSSSKDNIHPHYPSITSDYTQDYNTVVNISSTDLSTKTGVDSIEI